MSISEYIKLMYLCSSTTTDIHLRYVQHTCRTVKTEICRFTLTSSLKFLPRDATQSAVLLRQVVCPSISALAQDK